MQEVSLNGGPCKGYQSEVERGKKHEVSAATLTVWVARLKVTLAFVREELERYHSDPDRYQGLAGDVGHWVAEHREEWVQLSGADRLRYVLRRITLSRHFTPVVLAYHLHLDLRVLDEMILGRLPIPPEQVRALAGLTGVPVATLVGESDEVVLPGQWQAVLELAMRKGIKPDELKRWIEER